MMWFLRRNGRTRPSGSSPSWSRCATTGPRHPPAARNPFEGKAPPKMLRVLAYRYHFSTPQEQASTGNWWKASTWASIRTCPAAPLTGGRTATARPGAG